ncbi:hypothetical protein Hbl1158_15985 (plasmid) [Halobaculum sp. CBA1158]|uniref:hypothetical protein n=1 Tax=Halobaculum sp. CBA1158 TaxID=2904243 RepID=UPI001F20AB66|nr:hypothetical protein [Halobaculum sp. CBA1158]UIP01407.1 hypothetical protein Hbl1158_15985 [Halobaculum sp. CBA1158]
MDGADDDRTVEELAEYCRTQAGLLSGRVERMGEEASALLDEIDEGVADLRERLAERSGGDVHGPESPPSPDAPATGADTAPEPDPAGETTDDVVDLADAESTLREKQAVVEATETRMRLFRDLAADYLELAETIGKEHDDGDLAPEEAIRRVVEFEIERDAPAYFEERETLAEAASHDENVDHDGDTETDIDGSRSDAE